MTSPATTEELRLAGVVIESEPHVVTWTTKVASDLRAKARKMSFFRDSDENLVGLAGRRRIDPAS
jgi:hypothetical protein